MLALLGGWSPRILGMPDPARERAERHQGRRSLGIGRREQDRHARPFRVSEQRRALRPGGVRHRAHIVHPLLQGWQVRVGHAIGHPGAALVEQDQAAERCQAPPESRQERLVPAGLEVRDPAAAVDQVAGPIADHLVGDAHGAAPGVAGLGLLGDLRHVPASTVPDIVPQG